MSPTEIFQLMGLLHLLIAAILSVFVLFASLCETDNQPMILYQDDRSLSPEQYLLPSWQSSRENAFT
jgi:hypothetical protein